LDLATDTFTLPMWWVRIVMIATAAGLPLVLAAAWYYKVSPESGESEGAARSTVRAGMAVSVVLAVVIFLVLNTTLKTRDDAGAGGAIPGFGGRAAIAVMPFENLSDDAADLHFSDGRELDLPSVASSLGVRYVLVGSVRTAGDSVRVTAQLIDAESDTHIWASTFDRNMADVFAIQDDVTREIVSAPSKLWPISTRT
jgi:TolB-like protein